MAKEIPINPTGPTEPDENHDSPLFRVIDKRHFTDLDRIPADSNRAEQPRYPSFVEELMARLAETERNFEKKRRQVDEEIGRMRSRMEAEQDRRIEAHKRAMVLPYLEVLDNLERALDAATHGGGLDALQEGVAMTAALLRTQMEGQGIEALAVEGLPFDPNVGEAVGVVEVKDAEQDGIVIEEVLRGYRMGGSLLRPARVRVGKLVAPVSGTEHPSQPG